MTYKLPMYERLYPRTAWKGGRITHTDVLPLAEAAAEASRHADTLITPADFLRAASRGEITMRAIVHKSAKVEKHDGGIYCNQGEQTENTVPKGAIPTLPIEACVQLANTGRATWRSFDGFEMQDGVLCRFSIARLVDGESNFETTADDCRVTGDAVHALADAFVDCDDEISTSEAAQNENPPEGRQRQQEDKILRTLKSLGYDPKHLPRPPAGKPGPKKEVRTALKGMSDRVFAKAWERLRVFGDIADA